MLDTLLLANPIFFDKSILQIYDQMQSINSGRSAELSDIIQNLIKERARLNHQLPRDSEVWTQNRERIRSKLNKIADRAKCIERQVRKTTRTTTIKKFSSVSLSAIYKNQGGSKGQNEFSSVNPPFQVQAEVYHSQWQALIKRLSEKFIVNSLVLNLCLIDNTIVKYFVKYVSQTLQELWLGENIVEDQGATIIAKELRFLHLLSLASNRISDEGAIAIANWASPYLRKLKLQKNAKITTRGVLALVVQLPSLLKLQIYGTQAPNNGSIRRQLKSLSRQCQVSL